MYALAHNCVEQEGFEIRAMSKQDYSKRVDAEEITINPEDNSGKVLLTLEKLPETYQAKGKLEIWYKKERDYIKEIIFNKQYKGIMPAPVEEKQAIMYQMSGLSLKKGGVVFDKRGIIIKNHDNIVSDGFWAWSVSAAEWLPDDYVYKPKKH